jgi:hypothetical protein
MSVKSWIELDPLPKSMSQMENPYKGIVFALEKWEGMMSFSDFMSG